MRIMINSVSTHTAQKKKFSIQDFFSKCNQIRKEIADLVIFTEEILNGKLHFLCSANHMNKYLCERYNKSNRLLPDWTTLSLLNYLSYAPSHLTFLCDFVPSCLTFLPALGAFAPYMV